VSLMHSKKRRRSVIAVRRCPPPWSPPDMAHRLTRVTA
jgi:hypothetical protein